ncbi:histone-lysine N-methyltransferase SETMAR-like protein [Plakobranchus ocellatus]|uniref:Histone-lysine N-methyltransferase SETMAR-like protein n=1 Tax=Plakobranchus ocellatus TaxID=259542 RepID=A0AAV3XW48_9GAST|nr:histone-lysine N-methyltransferase SETMAR-like protein [Plakobranchus ocellatus]
MDSSNLYKNPMQLQETASFKGQMAARYQERKIMGFHITRVCAFGSAENKPEDSVSSSSKLIVEAGLTDQLITKKNVAQNVEGRRRPDGEPILPGQYKEAEKENLKDNSTVNARRSMKDLITHFERHSKTALHSLDYDQKNPVSVQKSTPKESCDDECFENTEMINVSKAVGEGNGGLVKILKGSSRSFSGLNQIIISPTSSSISLSEDETKQETASLRKVKSSMFKLKHVKPGRESHTSRVAQMERNNAEVLSTLDMSESENAKRQSLGGANGLGVVVSKLETDSKVADVTQSMKKEQMVGDYGYQIRPNTLDSYAPLCGNEKGKKEPFVEDLKNRDKAEAEAKDSENQDSSVPIPLRINLKDFATRKKRSSNTGDMKYVVHRKDWRKWVQNHQEPGSRCKQSDALPTSEAVQSESQQMARKSALKLRRFKKSAPSVSGVEKSVLSREPTKVDKKKEFLSTSNTQQRLDRRHSQKSLISSSTPGVLSSAVDGRLRKYGSAMERYLIFLNKAIKHDYDRETKQKQNQPLDGQQPQVAGTENDQRTSLMTSAFTSLTTNSPQKQQDGSQERPQKLLDHAHAIEKRHGPVGGNKEGVIKSQSKLPLKPKIFNSISPSTESFISNENTISTLELEKKTDRLLAHLEEVSASKKSTAETIKPTEAERIPSPISRLPLNTVNEKLRRIQNGKINTLTNLKCVEPIKTDVSEKLSKAVVDDLYNCEKESNIKNIESHSNRQLINGRKDNHSLTSPKSLKHPRHPLFRSISPWIRSKHDNNALTLTESRSKSSPASTKQELNFLSNLSYKTITPKIALPEHRKTTGFPSVSSIITRPNARSISTMYANQTFTSRMRAHSYQQKPSGLTKPRSPIALTIENTSKQNSPTSSQLLSLSKCPVDSQQTNASILEKVNSPVNATSTNLASAHRHDASNISSELLSPDNDTSFNFASVTKKQRPALKQIISTHLLTMKQTSPEHRHHNFERHFNDAPDGRESSFKAKPIALECEVSSIQTSAQEVHSQRKREEQPGFRNKALSKSMSAHSKLWHKAAYLKNKTHYNMQRRKDSDEANATTISTKKHSLQEQAICKAMTNLQAVEFKSNMKRVTPSLLQPTDVPSLTKVKPLPHGPEIPVRISQDPPKYGSGISAHKDLQQKSHLYQRESRFRLEGNSHMLPEKLHSSTFLYNKAKKYGLQIGQEDRGRTKIALQTTKEGRNSPSARGPKKPIGIASKHDQFRRECAAMLPTPNDLTAEGTCVQAQDMSCAGSNHPPDFRISEPATLHGTHILSPPRIARKATAVSIDSTQKMSDSPETSAKFSPEEEKSVKNKNPVPYKQN